MAEEALQLEWDPLLEYTLQDNIHIDFILNDDLEWDYFLPADDDTNANEGEHSSEVELHVEFESNEVELPTKTCERKSSFLSCNSFWSAYSETSVSDNSAGVLGGLSTEARLVLKRILKVQFRFSRPPRKLTIRSSGSRQSFKTIRTTRSNAVCKHRSLRTYGEKEWPEAAETPALNDKCQKWIEEHQFCFEGEVRANDSIAEQNPESELSYKTALTQMPNHSSAKDCSESFVTAVTHISNTSFSEDCLPNCNTSFSDLSGSFGFSKEEFDEEIDSIGAAGSNQYRVLCPDRLTYPWYAVFRYYNLTAHQEEENAQGIDRGDTLQTIDYTATNEAVVNEERNLNDMVSHAVNGVPEGQIGAQDVSQGGYQANESNEIKPSHSIASLSLQETGCDIPPLIHTLNNTSGTDLAGGVGAHPVTTHKAKNINQPCRLLSNKTFSSGSLTNLAQIQNSTCKNPSQCLRERQVYKVVSDDLKTRKIHSLFHPADDNEPSSWDDVRGIMQKKRECSASTSTKEKVNNDHIPQPTKIDKIQTEASLVINTCVKEIVQCLIKEPEESLPSEVSYADSFKPDVKVNTEATHCNNHSEICTIESFPLFEDNNTNSPVCTELRYSVEENATSEHIPVAQQIPPSKNVLQVLPLPDVVNPPCKIDSLQEQTVSSPCSHLVYVPSMPAVDQAVAQSVIDKTLINGYCDVNGDKRRLSETQLFSTHQDADDKCNHSPAVTDEQCCCCQESPAFETKNDETVIGGLSVKRGQKEIPPTLPNATSHTVNTRENSHQQADETLLNDLATDKVQQSRPTIGLNSDSCVDDLFSITNSPEEVQQTQVKQNYIETNGNVDKLLFNDNIENQKDNSICTEFEQIQEVEQNRPQLNPDVSVVCQLTESGGEGNRNAEQDRMDLPLRGTKLVRFMDITQSITCPGCLEVQEALQHNLGENYRPYGNIADPDKGNAALLFNDKLIPLVSPTRNLIQNDTFRETAHRNIRSGEISTRGRVEQAEVEIENDEKSKDGRRVRNVLTAKKDKAVRIDKQTGLQIYEVNPNEIDETRKRASVIVCNAISSAVDLLQSNSGTIEVEQGVTTRTKTKAASDSTAVQSCSLTLVKDFPLPLDIIAAFAEKLATSIVGDALCHVSGWSDPTTERKKVGLGGNDFGGFWSKSHGGKFTQVKHQNVDGKSNLDSESELIDSWIDLKCNSNDKMKVKGNFKMYENSSCTTKTFELKKNAGSNGPLKQQAIELSNNVQDLVRFFEDHGDTAADKPVARQPCESLQSSENSQRQHSVQGTAYQQKELHATVAGKQVQCHSDYPRSVRLTNPPVETSDCKEEEVPCPEGMEVQEAIRHSPRIKTESSTDYPSSDRIRKIETCQTQIEAVTTTTTTRPLVRGSSARKTSAMLTCADCDEVQEALRSSPRLNYDPSASYLLPEKYATGGNDTTHNKRDLSPLSPRLERFMRDAVCGTASVSCPACQEVKQGLRKFAGLNSGQCTYDVDSQSNVDRKALVHLSRWRPTQQGISKDMLEHQEQRYFFLDNPSNRGCISVEDSGTLIKQKTSFEPSPIDPRATVVSTEMIRATKAFGLQNSVYRKEADVLKKHASDIVCKAVSSALNVLQSMTDAHAFDQVEKHQINEEFIYDSTTIHCYNRSVVGNGSNPCQCPNFYAPPSTQCSPRGFEAKIVNSSININQMGTAEKLLVPEKCSACDEVQTALRQSSKMASPYLSTTMIENRLGHQTPAFTSSYNCHRIQSERCNESITKTNIHTTCPACDDVQEALNHSPRLNYDPSAAYRPQVTVNRLNFSDSPCEEVEMACGQMLNSYTCRPTVVKDLDSSLCGNMMESVPRNSPRRQRIRDMMLEEAAHSQSNNVHLFGVGFAEEETGGKNRDTKSAEYAHMSSGQAQNDSENYQNGTQSGVKGKYINNVFVPALQLFTEDDDNDLPNQGKDNPEESPRLSGSHSVQNGHNDACDCVNVKTGMENDIADPRDDSQGYSKETITTLHPANNTLGGESESSSWWSNDEHIHVSCSHCKARQNGSAT